MESLTDLASVAPEKIPSNCNPQNPTNGKMNNQISRSLASSLTSSNVVNNATIDSPNNKITKNKQIAEPNPHCPDNENARL